MDGGPFTIKQAEPVVIRKSEIQPAEKNDESKEEKE
jgi:hypothetical protein